MSAANPAERRLQATKASNIRWAKDDPSSPERREALERARAASPHSLDWFLRDVPADLPEAERIRRAECLRKVYFADLSLRSMKARRARKKKAPD